MASGDGPLHGRAIRHRARGPRHSRPGRYAEVPTDRAAVRVVQRPRRTGGTAPMPRQRLDARLARLEARRSPVAELPYTPPEPPPGFCEEVLRLLWAHGCFGSVEAMLHDILGITDATMAVKVS